jgi:hypothetical protein
VLASCLAGRMGQMLFRYRSSVAIMIRKYNDAFQGRSHGMLRLTECEGPLIGHIYHFQPRCSSCSYGETVGWWVGIKFAASAGEARLEWTRDKRAAIVLQSSYLVSNRVNRELPKEPRRG